jgi:Ni,Fe-hydrogenase III large subunit
MEKVTLSVNLVNGIMQYLGTKPFQEVAQFISAVNQEVNAQQDNTTSAPAPASAE